MISILATLLGAATGTLSIAALVLGLGGIIVPGVTLGVSATLTATGLFAFHKGVHRHRTEQINDHINHLESDKQVNV